MNSYLLWPIFIVCFYLPTTSPLNIDRAFKNGEFHQIYFDNDVIEHHLDPESRPSLSYYYDNSRYDPHHHHPSSYLRRNKTTIKLEVSNWSLRRTDFKVGVSIHLLYFSSNDISSLRIFSHMDEEEKELSVITDSIHWPETNYTKGQIFKSWDYWPDDKFDVVSLNIELQQWTVDSQVYLVTTAYKVQTEHSSEASQCNSWSFITRKWWNCNSDDGTDTQWSLDGLVCINYILTCDDLPHCADTRLPNSDENCQTEMGIKDALKMIIYFLPTVFVVLLVAGCTKCALRRSCICIRTDRRNSEERAILTTPPETPRPINAPPSYDDAMKFVNEAFALSDDEHDDMDGNRPPSYSQFPKEGIEDIIETSTLPSFNRSTTETYRELSIPRLTQPDAGDEQNAGDGTSSTSNLSKDPPAYANHENRGPN